MEGTTVFTLSNQFGIIWIWLVLYCVLVGSIRNTIQGAFKDFIYANDKLAGILCNAHRRSDYPTTMASVEPMADAYTLTLRFENCIFGKKPYLLPQEAVVAKSMKGV